MFDIQTLTILIPALPLTAALATAVLGRRVLRGQSHVPTVAALALSFAASMALVFQVQQRMEEPLPASPTVVVLWSWVGHSLPSPFGRGAGGEGGEKVASDDHHSSLFARHSSSNPKSLIPNPASNSPHPNPLPKGEGTILANPFPKGEGICIDVTLRADPLSAVMLALVTCISTLVAVYAIGYMRGDPGYWRFFAYIGLFVFAMTMLVSASNFVVLFVFWELVGLCSYLLIGFWYERPAAAAAGKKAFLVNRVGDAGFLLGVFLIWTTYGTLDFDGVFDAAGASGGWTATAICLLLLLGACGKSAQFPLHVWLPDAMEGPTPVSALIHAATMVTAGVYLIARCSPLMVASADAQHVVALVGGATALLGGVIAVTQTDLKRILAYSTISHLGYMFLAIGVGTLAGVTAGMFHLVTHAFFKALLFLAAGSVMHAAGGVIDIRRLGGLRRRMPITHWTFLIGCLAIAGVPPLAGFWSKDSILLALQQRAARGDAYAEMHRILFATSTFGILLIDLYMFRPFFMVFYGPERVPPETEGHLHESPGVMTVPLMILAFGSVVVGAYFEWTGGLSRLLAATPSLACLPNFDGAEPAAIGWTSSILTFSGIALTAGLYLGRRRLVDRLTRLMDVFGLYTLSYRKFFIDPIYMLCVVWPLLGVARLAGWFDAYVIDGLVDAVGGAPKRLGAALRSTQNGLVQFYALAMMLGLLVLLGALLM